MASKHPPLPFHLFNRWGVARGEKRETTQLPPELAVLSGGLDDPKPPIVGRLNYRGSHVGVTSTELFKICGTFKDLSPRIRGFWLTNYLETLLVQVWYPMTVATQSRAQKKAELTNSTEPTLRGVGLFLNPPPLSGNVWNRRFVFSRFQRKSARFCWHVRIRVITSGILRSILGPPVVPFLPLFGGGFPTEIDKTKKQVGTLVLTSLLEDPGYMNPTIAFMD